MAPKQTLACKSAVLAKAACALPRCRAKCGRKVKTRRSKLCSVCFEMEAKRSGARTAGNANATGSPGNIGNAAGNPDNIGNAAGNPDNVGNHTTSEEEARRQVGDV